MNSYDKALQKIKNFQNNRNYFCCMNGVVGPTGPTGPMGKSFSILGSFNSEEELIKACPIGNVGDAYMVLDNLYIWSQNDNEWVDIGEIKGPKGDMGPTGPQGPEGKMGPQGIQGEMGPQGPSGTSVTILGSFDSVQKLYDEHPIGLPGQSYLVGDDLYVWSIDSNDWVNVGQIRGPQGIQGERGPMGPQGPEGEPGKEGPMGPMGPIGNPGPQGIQGETGERGPQGEPGPLLIPIGYFFTSIESIEPSGEEVKSGYEIPIDVEVYNTDKTFFHTNINNTITFLKSGLYYVNFYVQARSNSEYISVGFKKTSEDTIYAGNSIWASRTSPDLIMGQGIINLPYPNEIFELINLSKSSIYLQSPTLENLNTESSFASPVVSIFILKLK